MTQCSVPPMRISASSTRGIWGSVPTWRLTKRPKKLREGEWLRACFREHAGMASTSGVCFGRPCRYITCLQNEDDCRTLWVAGEDGSKIRCEGDLRDVSGEACGMKGVSQRQA